MGNSELSQNYGVPLYGAAWAPLDHIQSLELGLAEQGRDRSYLVLAGGGEGGSGIPNAVLLAEFDFASGSLSQQPVAKLHTGSDFPYRMAVHPRGDGVICASPKGFRVFEWENPEDHKWGLKMSEKVLGQLEDAGRQLALVFSHDGSLLAAGGENGKLMAFKWPSMDIILNEDQAHSLNDLAFSLDGKFLVSLGDAGPCQVWDLTSSVVIASLPKENDEAFGFCRFSQSSDGTQVLYVTAFTGRWASILTWNTSSWKRTSTNRVGRDSVNAFNVSADGKLLAVGTGGDIVILNSTSMKPQTVVKKAHIGFVTALAFSHDSRAIISVSMDSSATVTQVQDANTGEIMRIVDKVPNETETAEDGLYRKAELVQDKIDVLQKDQVEMEDKTNNVMYVHLTNLGLYSLLCNIASLLLQAHLECKHSIWVCPVVGVIFIAGMLGELVISWFKIVNIRRVCESLLRRLGTVREEARILANSISRLQVLKQRAEQGHTISSSQSQKRGRTIVEIKQLKTRVEGLAATAELEGSLSRFYRASLWQLSIPSVALFAVFAAIIIAGHLSCVKRSRPLLHSLF